MTRQGAAFFFEKWVEACNERHERLFCDWPNCRAFTNHIFTGPDPVIEALAEGCRLKCYNNYYSIDSILFEERDLVPTAPAGQTWLRRIRVAFEHENDFASGLFQEVSHLMITDCDLRVVVSYPSTEKELRAELAHLHSVIAGSDRAAEIARSEAFLFIAGWREPQEKSIEWWGFLYDDNEWKEAYVGGCYEPCKATGMDAL